MNIQAEWKFIAEYLNVLMSRSIEATEGYRYVAEAHFIGAAPLLILDIDDGRRKICMLNAFN